jgi:two-component system OmpR family sensor kinase
VASGGTVHGALRVTLDIADVNERIRSFWLALVAIAAVVLAAVAMIGWVIARSVTRPLRALTESAERFASGDLAVTPTATGGPPEIRALDDTLTTMALQLDGLLSSQRAFVADASHQLRTPLTALRLRLENLQGRVAEDPSDRAVGAEIERAIDETGRLTELVTSLLQLARTDDRPDTRAEDVVELIRDRVDTWTAVAEERGVALVGPDRGEGPGEGSGGRVLVRVVPGAVEQILDNVLDNALLVSDVGSTVDVRLATSPDRVALCVVDRGPGLSDADKRDAMRRFWRGDTTRPGTGLGLAIVDALATASGGSAVLSDTDGGGLTVTVTLLRATD